MRIVRASAQVLIFLLTFAVAAPSQETVGPFDEAITIARERVVKLYGGGIGREHGYASGVLVSSNGQIVTALSSMLESPTLRAVLPDGRRFPARVTKRDNRRQIALLQIDVESTPYFDLTESTHLSPGEWLIAAANSFKVSDGPEPVSVAVGAFSGRATLAARRRAQDFPYDGPVLLTDVIVATPGSAGGAVVDVDGRLVGVIGQAVVSKLTNTWINYALPVEEIADFIADESDTTVGDNGAPDDTSDPLGQPDIGVLLLDIGGRTRPAYVERIRPGSPAQSAGIRPSDLILSIADTAIATCDEYRAAVQKLHSGDEIPVVVKRGDELLTLQIRVGERE